MARSSIAALLLLPLTSLAAQQPSLTLDAGGTGLRYGDSISAAGAAVTPALSVSRGLATLGAAATLSAFASGSSWQGSLSASTFTPSFRSLSGEAGASLGGSGHEDGSRTGEMLGFARAHIIGNTAGGWTGAGLGRTWDGASWRNVRQVELGAWARLPRAGILVGGVVPSAVDDTIRYTDTQIAARWELARTELGLTAGYRSGSRLAEIADASRVWGGVSVIRWITPKTAIVAGAGSYPLDFTQGYPAGRYVTLGIRLSSTRHETPLAAAGDGAAASSDEIESFTTSRIGANAVEFRVKASSARQIEIIGDFTQWSPVAMRSQGNGWWVVTLTVAPGTYEMNLRSDGGKWLVPPGLAAVRDESGGEVGMLTVPPR
jgi:hypothetical protein